MKKSFLIPCTYRHVNSLIDISKLLDMSSVTPEEVIIHISSCPENFDYKKILEPFFNKKYSFKYEITKDFRNAGMNRNNLGEHSSGELLIYQDADDYLHPQRIEFIEKSFEEEDVMHLAHSYIFNVEPIEKLQFEKKTFDFRKLFPLDIFYDLVFDNNKLDYKQSANYGNFENNKKIEGNLNYPIHNGAIAIRKQVVDKVFWKTKNKERIIAEDQDFNFECYYHFNKSFILLDKIYYYNLNNRTNGGF